MRLARFRSTVLLLALCAPLAGCLPGATSAPEVKAAVEQYHVQYNRGEFAEIYRDADVEMKQAETEQDFTRFLTLLSGKLGPVQKAEQIGFNIDARVGTNGGTRVTVTYRTHYATGEATETLVWPMRGGKPKLAGFNVNSPALLEGAPAADAAAAPGAPGRSGAS